MTMPSLTTPNIGATAYNDFKQFAKLSYNCISFLMDNNELVWKLLKSTDADAWTHSNLTLAEKSALIYSGVEDASLAHVFLDVKQPDVFTKETSILRICPYFAAGANRTIGYIEMSMEVYVHTKINHMTNYQTRLDTIVGELLGTFHGANVGGLGLMAFDKLIDQNARLFSSGQIPFGGKQIIITTKVA